MITAAVVLFMVLSFHLGCEYGESRTHRWHAKHLKTLLMRLDKETRDKFIQVVMDDYRLAVKHFGDKLKKK